MTRIGVHEEVQELLGVYALDAVDDLAEREEIEAHLALCAICRAELDEHREALALLTPDADDAGDEVWMAIRSRLELDVAEPVAPLATVLTFPRRRLAAVSGAAAALAAAASVAITLVLSGGDSLGPAELSAQVKPAAGAPDAALLTGNVRVYDSSSPGARIVIDLSGVPDAPSGHHYEVWVLRPNTTEMEAVGAFTPVDGRARLELRLPGAGEYIAVDISIEDNGGPPLHSGNSLAGAKLQ